MRKLTTYDLRAEDFGSPQERHRKFVVAAPEGMLIGPGAIDPPRPGKVMTVGEAIMGTGWVDHDADFFPLAPNELAIYVEIKDGGNWKDSDLGRRYARLLGFKPGENRKTFLRRMPSAGRPPCLLAATPRGADYRCDFVHPIYLRHITVGEQKRLMDLPGHFLLAGSIEERWRQAGNAVMPFMAELVGRAILEADRATTSGPTS